MNDIIPEAVLDRIGAAYERAIRSFLVLVRFVNSEKPESNCLYEDTGCTEDTGPPNSYGGLPKEQLSFVGRQIPASRFREGQTRCFSAS